MPPSRTSTAVLKKPADPKAKSAAPVEPPLKPQKTLFVALLAIFVIWIGALLTMYFTTVRSHGGRLEPLPATAQSAPL